MSRLSASIALGLLVLGGANVAEGQTFLEVQPSIVLTNQDPDGDLAAKIKIVRLGNGTLVVTYADAGTTELVYDVKTQTERPARDILSLIHI